MAPERGDFSGGQPFGKYILLGKIAQGGMAEIFRGRASTAPAASSTQILAIKCMRTDLAREKRFVEMFIREGKLAMLLDHPGIVRTFDVGAVDDRFFICMEYLIGVDVSLLLSSVSRTSVSSGTCPGS